MKNENKMKDTTRALNRHYAKVKDKNKHPASKCDNAKCLVCHPEKVLKIPNKQTLIANSTTN